MAPMTFARLQDARNLHVFEDHLLRYIILFFTRAAHATSKKDYEMKFHVLHRKIARSKTSKRRYKYLSSLTSKILRFLDDTRLNVTLKSISRLPGLHEFCQFVELHPWLKEQWEGIVVACTCQCWGTWIAKGPAASDFTILKIATEHWEWSCFRHFRDRFVLSAFAQSPCDSCVPRLHRMARLVEYDKIGVASRNYNPAIEFLTCCTPNPFMQGDIHIASLEPFVMILRQFKNIRWLAWWEPFIKMQTGFTVAEIYDTCRHSSRERNVEEGRTSPPRRIGDTMFEYRDLHQLAENIQRERVGLDHSMALWQRELNGRGHIIEDEAAPANPTVNRP